MYVSGSRMYVSGSRDAAGRIGEAYHLRLQPGATGPEPEGCDGFPETISGGLHEVTRTPAHGRHCGCQTAPLIAPSFDAVKIAGGDRLVEVVDHVFEAALRQGDDPVPARTFLE